MTRSALANSIAGCLAAAGLTAIVGVAGAGAAAAASPVPSTPPTTAFGTAVHVPPIPSTAFGTSAPVTALATSAPTAGVAQPPAIEVPAGNAGRLNSGGGISDAELVLLGLGVVLVGGAGIVGVRRR